MYEDMLGEYSRAFPLLEVFPRLPQVTCFPALTTGYMFSRAYRWFRFYISRVLIGYYTESNQHDWLCVNVGFWAAIRASLETRSKITIFCTIHVPSKRRCSLLSTCGEGLDRISGVIVPFIGVKGHSL